MLCKSRIGLAASVSAQRVAIESLIVLVNSCAFVVAHRWFLLVVAFEWGSVVANNYALALATPAGGSKCKGRGNLPGLVTERSESGSPLVAQTERSAVRKTGGDPLRPRGRELLRKGF